MGHPRAGAVAGAVVLITALLGPGRPAVAAGPAGEAPGAPGTLSHFDLARKDCLGTAAEPGSRVWYTVAGGMLSDVYSPTVDNTNVETMQYMVTDGATFTDLQARDMTYTVRSTDRSSGSSQSAGCTWSASPWGC